MLLCCISVNAQIDLSKETGFFCIDLREKHISAYNVKSDTTHFYVVFESYFRDTKVRLYRNDSLIYKDKITSNESIELAKVVRVGHTDSVKKISIGIEDSPLIVIFPMKGKYYININTVPYPAKEPIPVLLIRFDKYSIWRI